MIDDGLPTLTSEEQVELERKVVDIYNAEFPEGALGERRSQRCCLQAAAAAACRRQPPPPAAHTCVPVRVPMCPCHYR